MKKIIYYIKKYSRSGFLLFGLLFSAFTVSVFVSSSSFSFLHIFSLFLSLLSFFFFILEVVEGERKEKEKNKKKEKEKEKKMKEIKNKERKEKAIAIFKELLSWQAEHFIFEVSVGLIIASIIAFIYLPVFSAGCIVVPIFALYYTALLVWRGVLERKDRKKEKVKDER